MSRKYEQKISYEIVSKNPRKIRFVKYIYYMNVINNNFNKTQ